METIFITRENLLFCQEKAERSVMALGFFDGLHRGHCEVIKTASHKAKENNVSLSVMSFFPHPKTVISNGKRQVCYLMPLSEKKERLRELGVDTFYMVEFDQEFASLAPEQFVAEYLLGLGVVHAVAGFDFSYGYKGTGNMERLKRDANGLIEVTKVEKVECKGEKISSTCIRERLLSGKVEELPDFLGSFYEVQCDWDGFSLKPHPYYTLPAPGTYFVTLQNGLRSVEAEMSVTETHSLKTLTPLPFFLKGRLSIIWHRRLSEEKSQPRGERKLLISSI
ncbi:FAD synthetase family protein [Bacillus benzoevorans]|uniref:FAD synthase n=1 Tax=Bacillus benzoevorans TaxID=1456 RepID=A0A7X0HU57_9BACI|nr:FAD synthetase family protein [Bacillus benzoevorans]MBB6446917.1 riboflavin kinase/FMN adenylyltransferase [Bacillus benzoevorans]